jgi:hypothetical protein
MEIDENRMALLFDIKDMHINMVSVTMSRTGVTSYSDGASF